LKGGGLGSSESRAGAPVALGRALLLGLLAALRQPASEAAGLPQEDVEGSEQAIGSMLGAAEPPMAAVQSAATSEVAW
jgi:hypothetical protein